MARFSDDFLEQINSATDIVAVISEYVQLRRSGAEFKGLCPFHGEKSPSFSVHPGKGVFTCRGCGENGNAAQFLVKYTGQNFREVVTDLARRANIPMPRDDSRVEDRQATEITRLTDLLQRASQFYRDALQKSPHAQSYLKDRGVTPAMIEKFGIGYAPANGYALRQALPDASERDLIAAGLAFKSEFQNQKVIEYMRDRIIFPIASSSGKTVAFGGRKLQEESKGPKYLNTPETLVFKKSAQLFGLHQASPAIRKSRQVVIVEGYLDVVIPSGNGIDNIVSPMGTAFSAQALRKLFTMANEAVFCFDGDKAGRTAASRALEISADTVDDEHRTRYAFLPEGIDPDVYVRENGAQAMTDLLGKAEPMSRFLLREYSSRSDMTCAEGKASFASQAMSVIERIQAPTLKALIIEDVRALLGPNIPLPGVTPGVPAVSPAPVAEPARSGFRAFHARTAAAMIASAHIPSSTLPTARSNDAPTIRTRVQSSSAPSMAEAAGRGQPVKENQDDPASSGPASAPSSPADSQPKRVLGFRSMRTMVSAARDQDSNEVPTPALRMIAFVLRDPHIATFVTPNEAAFLDGSPTDVEAIQAVCASVDVDMKSDTKTDTITRRQMVLSALQGTHHEPTLERAMQLPEFLALDMDVAAESAAIMGRCAKRAQRRFRMGSR